MTDHRKLRQLRRFVTTDDARYPGKKKLKVKGRDLQNLALEVFSLTELEVLDLSPEREACLEYHLDECPPEIAKLINLQVLMLDTNEIYDVPASITRLPKLEKLSLSNNHIEILPHGFSSLVTLTSLHLANNMFQEIPYEVLSLENLEFFDISSNQVTEVPPDIARLVNLHSLIMYDNRIEVLPDSVTEMFSLRCLWLGKNRLTQLPRQFGHLNLTDWDNFGHHMFSTIIDGNPLTEPPMEICKQGIRAIAQYFGSSSNHSQGRYDSDDIGAPQQNTTRASYDRDADSYPATASDQAAGQRYSNNDRGNTRQNTYRPMAGPNTTFTHRDRAYFPVGASDQVTRIGSQQQQRQRNGPSPTGQGVGRYAVPRRSYNNTPRTKNR